MCKQYHIRGIGWIGVFVWYCIYKLQGEDDGFQKRIVTFIH